MRFNYLSLVALTLYLLKAQPVISAGRDQKLLCMPVTNVYGSHPIAVEARNAILGQYAIGDTEE
jgi:hypothetical protein